MYIHLENDKPNHNSFNIISYDRTCYTDIHFGNNIIKGFKWIILLWYFCLIFLFVSCYNFSKNRIPQYTFWLRISPRKEHTPRKTCYLLTEQRRISRQIANSSRIPMSTTNSLLTVGHDTVTYCIFVIMRIKETQLNIDGV